MKVKRAILVAAALLCALVLFAALRGNPFVDRSLCVGCEDCKTACPVEAIKLENGKARIDQDKCIDCRSCAKACQYRAIRVPQ